MEEKEEPSFPTQRPRASCRGDTWLDGGLEITGPDGTRRPANPALPPAHVWLERAGQPASPSRARSPPRPPDASPCVSAGSAGQGRQFASSAYRTIKIRGVRALCVCPVHWFPATSSSGGSTDQLAAGSPRPRVERPCRAEILMLDRKRTASEWHGSGELRRGHAAQNMFPTRQMLRKIFLILITD